MRFFCPRIFCLRLRVVANSDTARDQAVKLRVRDAVLKLAARWPVDVSAILAEARRVEPTARVRRGWLRFGGYRSRAVEITLGSGAGHNWWGMLYPDLSEAPDEPVQFESWFMNLLRKWGWI